MAIVLTIVFSCSGFAYATWTKYADSHSSTLPKKRPRRTVLELELGPDGELQHLELHRLLERHDAPHTTESLGVFLPDEACRPVDVAQRARDLRAEPVVEAVRDRVERGVRSVDGDARGGAAEERRLERVRERDGGEGFEDGRVVGDDEGGRAREGFFYYRGGKAKRTESQTLGGTVIKRKGGLLDGE